MDLYREMYDKLFNKITDVTSELQAAQQEAEELFLSHEMEEDAVLYLKKK